MTSTHDVDDFLFGSSCPSAKFPEIGTVVRGTITAAEMAQQTEADTRKPRFFDDGQPMMQLVITLQTEERDREIDDDDGRRRLFAKGGKGTDQGMSMKDAIADAVKKAGQKRIEQGATLAVKYVADGPKPSPTKSAPKLYRAHYTPPVKGVDLDDEFGAPTPARQPAAPWGSDEEPF